MKTMLYTCLFLVGAMSAVMDATADETAGKFEIEPGCIYNKSHGRCIVQNKTNQTIRCAIKIVGKNGATPLYTYYGNLPLKPHEFTEIDVYAEGKMTHIDAQAICSKTG